MLACTDTSLWPHEPISRAPQQNQSRGYRKAAPGIHVDLGALEGDRLNMGEKQMPRMRADIPEDE